MKVSKMFVNDDNPKVVASFTVEVIPGFFSSNWRLINGVNGYFISGPSYKLKEPKEFNGKMQEYQEYNLLKKEVKEELMNLAVAEYENLTGGKAASKSPKAEEVSDDDFPF